MKIKKGDSIIVIAGKDKGKAGKVLKAYPKLNRILVEGVNLHKKHKKPGRGGTKGQVIEMSLPIDVSNVKLAEGKKKKVAKK